ncbi:hypothetical protein [Phytoactinopolyspora mesophila]|uniref:Uncharacterized protein n=1 Tax=Phytoactinopolyspora mesophila TaxID=2650750 RepID=A0A7K3M752_9ACTN|nr:hypothetical protein [Phytoactinopolyspora mesophila]NDL59149.1 hypothetical protein [Phytoactinopolyspora mesophila]
MNIKHIIKLTSQALAAGGAVRAFTKARREGDTLKMVDAGLAAASVAVAIAVVVREVRQGEDHSRIVELEDAS